MTATVAGWIAYAADRGTTVADDASSAAALVRADDYINRFYMNRVVSTPPNAIVEEATYEAANYELATPGFFSKTYVEGDRKVLTEARGIKWSVIGSASGGAEGATPIATSIEAMFYPYMLDRTGVNVSMLSVGRDCGL